MAQPITQIHVDHHPAIYEVKTNQRHESRSLTLLELIEAVSEVSETEQEVVATVTYMLNSGRIRLADNFRDTPISSLLS